MTREELFKLAFGGSSPVFLTVPLGKEKEEKQPLYNGIKLKKDELEEYTAGDKKVYSDFGTEVIFPVWFEAGDYWSGRDTLAKFQTTDWNYDPTLPLSQTINLANNINTVIRQARAKVKMEEFRLPNATMVDFSRGKNITTTQVYGRTVKEIYGFDDWQIRIRMLCIAEKNRGMTGQQIAHEVIKWVSLADQIGVIGRLFTDKDIHFITLDSIDVKSIEGSPDTVPIELLCSSDFITGGNILVYKDKVE